MRAFTFFVLKTTQHSAQVSPPHLTLPTTHQKAFIEISLLATKVAQQIIIKKLWSRRERKGLCYCGRWQRLGAAVAREMNKRRYKLALMSPSENCEKLANELAGIAVRRKAENAMDTKALLDATMEKYGHIDSLLIYVGGPPKGDLLDIADEDWIKANEMVLLQVIKMSKLVTPIMKDQGGGSMVNITTFSAFEPSLTFPTSSVYPSEFHRLQNFIWIAMGQIT